MQVRRTSYYLSDPSSSARRSPRLSVVKSPSLVKNKRMTKKLVTPLALLACLTISFLLLTWVRIGQLEAGYAISKLEAEQAALHEQVRALELEIAVLKRPERIRRIASRDLHLKAPGALQVIRLKESPEAPK
jgi:cell division protein FtsL